MVKAKVLHMPLIRRRTASARLVRLVYYGSKASVIRKSAASSVQAATVAAIRHIAAGEAVRTVQIRDENGRLRKTLTVYRGKVTVKGK